MVVRTGDVAAFAGQRPADLIVVVPGILGSRLARSDSSGDLGEIWGTGRLRLAKNLATFGRALQGLALPEDEDPDDPGDGVVATGVITDLAVLPGFLAVAGYDSMIERLQAELPAGQVVAFPYDWRLSSRVNGRRFAEYLERAVSDWQKLTNNRSARAVVIAHSMGGLVSRWAIEKEGVYEHVSRLVTLGTPYRGAAKALDALANGLRLPQRVGPRFDSLVQSLPAVRELLPIYACVRQPGVRDLQYLGDTDVLPEDWVTDGLRLHDGLAEAVTDRDPRRTDELIAFFGNQQATVTTAAVQADGSLRMFTTIDGTERGKNWRGDGTVPADSAIPPEWPDDKEARPNGQQHASMQVAEQVWLELGHRLWDRPRPRSGGEVPLGVRCPEVVAAGEPLTVSIDGPRGLGLAIEAIGVDGGEPVRGAVSWQDGAYQAVVNDLSPDVYTVLVRRLNEQSTPVEELSTIVTVFTED